jgi:hypothetical protein
METTFRPELADARAVDRAGSQRLRLRHREVVTPELHNEA